MPIQSGDIKLLKSAVMADTSDGGGAMTGTAIVDGQSNNLFPDTSNTDRAIGRVQARKVFGVAHTDDTSVGMGAHALIVEPPADPLVHCTLIRTPGWADTRDTARTLIERYLVKGPRLNTFLYDNHYAGSLTLRLFSESAVEAPDGGDAIVIRSVDGTKEQYVRVLKVTQSTQTAGKKIWQVATCDLGQELAFDFDGPAMTEEVPNIKQWSGVYTTTPSVGAKFYGIKPLGAAATTGDFTVTASGGIMTPVVPAATVESPLVDQYPLARRSSLSRTAQASVTLTEALTLGPSAALRVPTPIEPRSLTITQGSTSFTDAGGGVLKQGSTPVGAIDYKGGAITFDGAAPTYGSGSVTISYKPSTAGRAAVHSDAQTVTIANQGLAYTYAFEPPPAPGTFTLSFLAQGRWYDLQDNGDGRLAGSDTGYGSGTVNYTTGSIGVTLGAVPDIGGALIYQWGDAAAAKAISDTLPSRVMAELPVEPGVKPDTLTLAWSRGATNYTASCSAAGVLSGNASGKIAGTDGSGNVLIGFEPSVFPDGAVTLSYQRAASPSNVVTNNGAGSYTLSQVPAAPGSVHLTVLTVAQAGFEIPASVEVQDNGSGVLLCSSFGAHLAAVGTVDYTTGAVQLADNVALDVYEHTVQSYPASSGNTLVYEQRVQRAARTVTLQNASLGGIAHAAGALTAATATVTPAWKLKLPVATGLQLQSNGLAFTLGSELYHAADGVLKKGWSVSAGTATVAAAGTVSPAGTIALSSLPANGNNAITWANAAQDVAPGKVGQGVFRTASAPIKTGVFQIQAGGLIGNGNGAGVVSGGGWSGSVDYQRGIVRWNRTASYSNGYSSWTAQNPVGADELSYNAVTLQYLPLDASLLGLETARLPLDGKVPIFRAGELALVHNTQSLTLPNPVTRDAAQNLGRQRLASVRVVDALGAVVTDTLYTVDLNAGTLTVPTGSNLTAYTQPLKVFHRIEDMLLTSLADISGQLKFTRSLTHDYPADTSYVSSVLPFGDLAARSYSVFEQSTWTSVWQDTRIGSAILANFNEVASPIAVTNRGAITERWAIIFTSSTAFRVVGESVGEIGVGNINEVCAPVNPATGVPYFTIPAAGWGGGWAVGNVLRINTDACGAPFWPIRTVLQGPASVDSDKFTIAFRVDVDRP